MPYSHFFSALSRYVENIVNFDLITNVFMDKINHAYPLIVPIATWVTDIGGTFITTTLGIIFGLVFLLRQKWRIGCTFLLSTASTALLLLMLKQLFLRARPENAFITMVNDPSFPSGHSGMAASFFVILAYFVAPKIRSSLMRGFFISICALIVIAVGLSRVILNVHWASDVIAGWSLGILLATVSIVLVRYVGKRVQG